MEEPVLAVVILRARDGTSILDAEGAIGAENASRFEIEAEQMREGREALTSLGFEVVGGGAHSITVRAPRELLEEVFATRVRASAESGEAGSDPAGAGAPPVSLDPVRIPAALQRYVADVTLAVRPELFP